jgi:outer membrane receptor protein involved in Fe transport
MAVWASLLAPLAQAQTTPTSPGTPTPPVADKPAEQGSEQIVISGSRIKRDTFTSTAPILILRNEDAAVAGFTSTAELLQGTAVTGGQGQINNAYGGFVTDGGPGANTLGLRGFGPTRSLVLLNGRRLAPSGTRGSVGAADLNTLPDAIVDRIEVLKDGASSIYGSDAIAGVVNIITRRNITGVTGSVKLTKPASGGEETRLSLVGGFVTDGAYLSGSYEHYKRNELTLGQRDWAKCNTDYRRTSAGGVVGDWGSWDYVDPNTGKPKCYPITGTGSNGVTINTLGTTTTAGVGAKGAVGTTFNRWRPNASVTTGLVGYEGVGNAATNLNVRDTFDPRTLNRSLISPTENDNLYLQGGMDLKMLGDAELYYEVMYDRRDSQQTGYRQLALDYNKGSPLIPSALAFSTFLGPQVTSSGFNVGVRAFIGFGNDHSSQLVEANRAVLGIRGTLPKVGWDYDVVATQSESKGQYTFESFLTNRLAQSLNVVASGSGFTCVDPSNGCVAAPALTPAVIGGQLPQSWVDFMFRPVTGVSKYRETTLTASTTGKLLDLPYGKLKGAFGAEVRQYSINDTPSVDAQIGNLFNLTSSTPTRGKDKVVDAFAELDIPLLANLPAVHELTANLSGRWSDYDSYGSGSTYKGGLLWSPVKWLSLRGTQGTSFRAPALYEQFLGATSGFLASSGDPCNNWDAPGNVGSVRSKNCASEGLPAGFAVGNGNNTSITVLNSGGAAAGLKAETSDNTTVGIVFQPALGEGLGDFSLAADYFNIKVSNGVSRAGTSNILSLCYDDPQFRSGGGFCRLVNPRNPTTNALTVNDSFVNLATDAVRGMDYTLRYTNSIGVGKLRVNVTYTDYKLQATQLFSTDPVKNFNGNIGSPKRTGNLDVYYDVKGWRAYYGMDWVGRMSSYAYYGEDPATSIYKLDTAAYAIHNVSLGYRGDKWSATLGVRNLADKQPPKISAVVYNKIGDAPLYSGYDYVGRTVFLNASKSF